MQPSFGVRPTLCRVEASLEEFFILLSSSLNIRFMKLHHKWQGTRSGQTRTLFWATHRCTSTSKTSNSPWGSTSRCSSGWPWSNCNASMFGKEVTWQLEVSCFFIRSVILALTGFREFQYGIMSFLRVKFLSDGFMLGFKFDFDFHPLNPLLNYFRTQRIWTPGLRGAKFCYQWHRNLEGVRPKSIARCYWQICNANRRDNPATLSFCLWNLWVIIRSRV